VVADDLLLGAEDCLKGVQIVAIAESLDGLAFGPIAKVALKHLFDS
jgi:hypothetical protein